MLAADVRDVLVVLAQWHRDYAAAMWAYRPLLTERHLSVADVMDVLVRI